MGCAGAPQGAGAAPSLSPALALSRGMSVPMCSDHGALPTSGCSIGDGCDAELKVKSPPRVGHQLLPTVSVL